jgi:protein JSN1
VRARKALNGRDVLGSDVGAIRIGFAKVPTKGNPEGPATETEVPVNVQGVGQLSVGATIHALRSIKGASTIPVDQQVLSGSLENYRSNLLLSMIGSGLHTGGSTLDGTTRPGTWSPLITEQQMIMRELSGGGPDAEADITVLAGKFLCAPVATPRPSSPLQTSVLLPCTTPRFHLFLSDLTTEDGMLPS